MLLFPSNVLVIFRLFSELPASYSKYQYENDYDFLLASGARYENLTKVFGEISICLCCCIVVDALDRLGTTMFKV